MMRKDLAVIEINDTVICIYLNIYKNLYWLNIDYWHPQMCEDDGEPIIKGIMAFPMRFKKC